MREVSISEEISPKILLQQAPTESGIYSNHLRWLLGELRQNTALAAAYKTAIATTTWVEVDPMEGYLLWSLGLVKKQGNKVMPRFLLYQQYFRQVL